jgi:hypothetical protein
MELNMFNKIIEKSNVLLQGLITNAPYIASAPVIAVVIFFITMTAYRLIGLLWHNLFSFPWSF